LSVGPRRGHDALTRGLMQLEEVREVVGTVKSALLYARNGLWTVRLEGSHGEGEAAKLLTKRLVLCTGSSPIVDPSIIRPETLDLDTVLDPERLAQWYSQVRSADSIGQVSAGRNLSGQNLTVQDLPVQNVPVQNTPLQDIPVQDIPVQDIPVQNAPVQNVPVQNLSGQDLSGRDLSGQKELLQNDLLQDHSANSSSTPTTIAVVGASHSAILALMNLYNLAKRSAETTPLLIKWFTRHPLRYAEEKDGWILRDNTGLKGAAAGWAREHLEPGRLGDSDVGKYVTKIAYEAGAEAETFEEHMGADCAWCVQAIGYQPDPLPTIRIIDQAETKKPDRAWEGREITPVFDHDTGRFWYETADGKKEVVLGLFGAGIAFPERVTDPLGNVEYAVGFWKFMKFVKRVVPGWVKS
jgi:hypothetical protein